MALRSTPHLFITTLLKFTQLLVAWRRHRAELLEACPPGRRPWGFWMVERRLRQHPAGEIGQLRAIRDLEIYRSEEEMEFVLRRLEELKAKVRADRRVGEKRRGAEISIPTPPALSPRV